MRRSVPGLVALSLVAAVLTACGTARDAPPLALPVNSAPSAIFDADGELITVLQEQNRSVVTLDQVPAVAQNAVIAIEDSRFWSHDGVDPRAVARAAASNARSGEINQGGSTITQQYVKNALLSPERSLERKLEEASLALALERNYSKRVILEQYLNTIYFGNGAYGIDAAARTYFGVPAAGLTLEKAALLAGIISAPSSYDPRRNPEAALERRNQVLDRMAELALITDEQRDFVEQAPLELAPPQPLPEQTPYPAPHFVDAVKEYLLTGSDILGDTQSERFRNLYRGGLRITTTIDLDLQALAEQSIEQVLPGRTVDPRTPDAALVSIEPKTGFVRAMVGGADYFGTSDYRQTNLARGAGRQTGSVFKPVVMAAALANGVPTSRRWDAPRTVTHRVGGTTWTVSGGGIGSGNLEECTVVSSNTCFANIILDPDVGPERAVDMARKLGVTETRLEANPAAVLGTNNATVEEMASVYATFADGGIHVPKVYVTRIQNADGTLLHEHRHSQTKVLEPEVARSVSEILPGVITRGTGTAADIGRPAAGKTGTSENNVDAWFAGYAPQLATAVWVGFATPRPDRGGVLRPVAMQPSTTRITVYGGTYPAQIWSRFMRAALADSPALPLFDPNAVAPPTTTVPPSNTAALEPMREPSRTSVPDVAGLVTDRAVARVRSAGFTVERLEVGPEAGRPGTVAGQSPPGGTEAVEGSTVYLEAVAGPFVPDEPVPDLRGFGGNQAVEELTRLGFTAELDTEAPPAGTRRPDGGSYVPGQVWRTVPAAGETSTDGRVTVVVMPVSAAPSTTTTTRPRSTTGR